MTYFRRADIEVALELWAQEYGGSKYENVGYPPSNILHRLCQGSGFNSAGSNRSMIRTRGDDVETIVRAMTAGDMYREAAVLRDDYFHPNSAMPARLDRLRSVGVRIGKNSYPEYLETAKDHVRFELWALRKAA